MLATCKAYVTWSFYIAYRIDILIAWNGVLTIAYYILLAVSYRPYLKQLTGIAVVTTEYNFWISFGSITVAIESRS